MNHWLEQLKLLQSSGEHTISIAVASTKGSVPREAGTRMLVTAANVFGTIGGGHLEFKAIAIARELLADGGPFPGSAAGSRPLQHVIPLALHRFPLGASLGQCCGGLVNLLFEPVASDAAWVDTVVRYQGQGTACTAITPVHGHAGKMIVSAENVSGSGGNESLERELVGIARERMLQSQPSTLLSQDGVQYFFEVFYPPNFNIVLFGAGHVGRALVKILADLPCRLRWVDSREEEFPLLVPAHVEKRVSDAPEDEVALALPDSYFVVMTHNHQLDQRICEHIFQRDDFAYFGMIGSVSKRRQFERRLAARGVSLARMNELVCPIGANATASKEPMAIAVSVAQEILQRRDSAQHALQRPLQNKQPNR